MSEVHAETVRFVRDTMLPEQEPPLTEKGVVKWLRENLFSGWANTALTLVTIYVVYTALSAVLPWIFGGVWNAGNLSECRSILEAFGKTSHEGACWAVIQERWNQFLFGFYPQDLYWRPILTFLLLFVALAPILFSEFVPRQMIWFTAIFPFVAVWLIWGGSFWLPIFALAGFAIAGGLYSVLSDRLGGAGAGLVALIGAVLWWGWLSPTASDTLHRMIATPQVASAKVELPVEIERLGAAIAEIDGQRAELREQISALLAEKEEIQERLVAGRAEGADLDADLAAFAEVRDRIAALRDADSALSRERAILSDQQTAANLLNNRVGNIERLEAELPTLRETATRLRASLPPTVASLQVAQNLPPSIPEEDVDALEAALSAENTLVNTEIAVRETYTSLGLVGLRPVGSTQLGGFLLAITVGVSGIVLSLPLGILLALGRQSDMFIINKFSIVFIEVIRGVPLIVWLFTASLLLNYFLPPGTNFDIMLRVIIMVTLFSAAYIAEVVRGGLAALPRGQYEAADALGLDYAKAMRLIILPQALKISIPGIVNTFIGLFKDTTLVVFVGLFDPLKQMADSIRADANWTGIYWELFVFPGLIFFILCYSMGRYSMYLERKLQREHR